MRYSDIDPMDLDPDTGRPYANYSSPSLDTSLHDAEMEVEDTEPSLLAEIAAMVEFDTEFQAEEAADVLNGLIARARKIRGRG